MSLTSLVWLKDSCRVPLDPQSSCSVKLLPSAPRSSCHFPSSTSPLSSFPLCVLLSPRIPSLSSSFTSSLSFIHPVSLHLSIHFYILKALQSFFTLLYDTTISSLCPSLINPSPLVGHMILVSLPPSFCLHTIMIQRTWDPPRERERDTEMGQREGRSMAGSIPFNGKLLSVQVIDPLIHTLTYTNTHTYLYAWTHTNTVHTHTKANMLMYTISNAENVHICIHIVHSGAAMLMFIKPICFGFCVYDRTASLSLTIYNYHLELQQFIY